MKGFLSVLVKKIILMIFLFFVEKSAGFSKGAAIPFEN